VGGEYREAMGIPTTGLNVKYVHPMLYYPENIQNIITALEGEFATGNGATIVCAHGNEKYPEYNAELIQMDQYLRENYDNAYVAVMEGTPEFDPVMETVLESDVDHIKFITFMMTFGDHMSNDVMGDEEDSFKTQIGLPAECSDGLASLPAVQALIVQKIDQTLAQF
ncbi:MAG: sirohydrochlorin cobaltochelatase, partial [Spirochaetales bacterium]|nr:sirohydrochlorin cobaltochelatase [Spirochaetales bacterium]